MFFQRCPACNKLEAFITKGGDKQSLTHLVPVSCEITIQVHFTNSFGESLSFPLQLVLGEYHRAPLISQHWFRLWLGAVRQKAVPWTIGSPELYRHIASLFHNELTHCGLGMPYGALHLANIVTGHRLSPAQCQTNTHANADFPSHGQKWNSVKFK